MRGTLFQKILVAMVLMTTLVLVGQSLLARYAVRKGFADFLKQEERAQLSQLIPTAESIYDPQSGWDPLRQEPGRFFGTLRPAQPPAPPRRPPRGERREEPGRGTPPPSGRGGRERGRGPRGGPGRDEFTQRLFLLDENRQSVLGLMPPGTDPAQLLAIRSGDAVVGWLGLAPRAGSGSPEERAFLTQQNQILIGALSAGIVLSGLLAFWLARSLSRPVTAAAAAAREIASGRYEVKLNHQGTGELAGLAKNLNSLGETLLANQDARERWMAEMAHELRTPLTILRGELEAIRDGVHQADDKTLASLINQARLLNNLVNDLRDLALADSGALTYKLSELELTDLAQDALTTFALRASDKQLELKLNPSPVPLPVLADASRLQQLVQNLMENSLRYTDAPGQIALTLARQDRWATLTIDDTPPGVSAAHLDRLFEPLFRAEESRSRALGGSGLGLTIAQRIAQAHRGELLASDSPLGGLRVVLKLPLIS
ncbi:MAG: ATP-binding protein [Pseudomonadota bacterium]